MVIIMARLLLVFTVISVFIQATWTTGLHTGMPRHNVGISGGHPISIEAAPFMASILYKSRKHKRYVPFCGGSIIHERFILTAAHCFDKITHIPTLRVIFGIDNLSEKGRVLHKVRSRFCYENYSRSSFTNDICLLKLKRPVQFGAKVAKVGLPAEDLKLETGVQVNVSGWGESEVSGATKNLRQVTIPIVSEEICRNDHQHLTDREICAGSRGHDACKGDSGDPLTYNNIQIGLVSYGEPCSIYSNGVGVYTRVSSYLKWINDTISKNVTWENLYS